MLIIYLIMLIYKIIIDTSYITLFSIMIGIFNFIINQVFLLFTNKLT